ncbi:Hypothetical protein NTJ_04067 [Nesidiocoris tenuis]|uniref:Uncharacterized protein n=1 Tax=Nesidiocoris tenuis TaxID=355587 RepID=A0ABN7AJ94_9HEMI|nr:Hypothetical protein NTJ_04067 [Nesidiocoris tenuis]
MELVQEAPAEVPDDLSFRKFSSPSITSLCGKTSTQIWILRPLREQDLADNVHFVRNDEVDDVSGKIILSRFKK